MSKRPHFGALSTGNRRGIYCFLLATIAALLISLPVYAQQTGEIFGQVTAAGDGSPVAGVDVTATSNVLPGVRSATTSPGGEYRLPHLPPGYYTITYTLQDGTVRKRATEVLLQQRATVDLAIEAGIDDSNISIEEVMVVASVPISNTTGASLNDGIGSDEFDALPVGQEYRDLIKLVPGVQYTQDSTRGPSAGGSGQDNAYQFDGVDVSMPMFGTLSAEPSTHDIEQVSVVRGGAKAVGFNRSGGFTVNTKSKSGTDEFHGSVSYTGQTAGMVSDITDESVEQFDEDRAWTAASLSGPILADKLFFYGSYYRPTVDRVSRANAYGEVGDYKSVRDEYFLKFTLAPTENLLFDASYRTSERTGENLSVGDFAAASTSEGDEATMDIGILEGSWIIDDNSSSYFKFTDFKNETSSRPDNMFGFPIAIGDTLNVGALAQQGLLSVPQIIDGEDAYNQFIQPLIDQYGYMENGVATGGGEVGGASTINDQNFYRQSFEIGYDYLIEGETLTHDLHFGYRYSKDEEDLSRTSNGWGYITVPGGRTTTDDGTPIFYEASFNQMSLEDGGGVLVPSIHSEMKAHSFEINDTITWEDWTFSLGVLVSNDELYGQGLKPNSSNLSGFEVAAGHKYLMHEIPFKDMIQPRLGVTWDYDDRTTLFANYALYNPAASSLARAASWARNLRKTIRAYFDENGNFIEADEVRSSSGKLFQEGMDPRQIQEFLVGGTMEVSSKLTTRAHLRYRKGSHFWEDTNNNARSRFEPPAGIPTEDYISNLDDIRAEIGGSSYVIAELDNAFTKYLEASLEAEWRDENYYVRGSYTWSHYYGNFDQDNSTTSNDANTFIGSSFIADGAGRQLWDNRYGDLRGDRRHMLKIYGNYDFSWDGSLGAYLVYQSGQPWEAWDVEVYRHLTGSSSDTSRYAEPAGSRTTDSHWQLDLNYTHDFFFGSGYNVQLRADIFNVFDNQTGYNIQNKVNSAGFGDPRDFFDPRRFQLTAKFLF